jgi:hypothetical protein
MGTLGRIFSCGGIKEIARAKSVAEVPKPCPSLQTFGVSPHPSGRFGNVIKINQSL